MRSGEFHGVQDSTVIPDLDACVGPPVKAVTCVVTVIKRSFLFEVSAAGPQCQLNTPLHAIGPVDIASPDRSAAIRFARHGKVHRRNRHPIVRDRKVEFDPECRPHAAVGNASELDGGVRIKHRRAVDLIDARIEMASKIG